MGFSLTVDDLMCNLISLSCCYCPKSIYSFVLKRSLFKIRTSHVINSVTKKITTKPKVLNHKLEKQKWQWKQVNYHRTACFYQEIKECSSLFFRISMGTKSMEIKPGIRGIRQDTQKWPNILYKNQFTKQKKHDVPRVSTHCFLFSYVITLTWFGFDFCLLCCLFCSFTRSWPIPVTPPCQGFCVFY